MKNIITLTGDIGSGKSTVAAVLRDKLGYAILTTGSMLRELAARQGITVLELNKQAMSDSQVDRMIDGYIQDLNARGDQKLILDSRLAWHFVQGSFNVFLYVDPLAAGRRVLAHNRPEEAHTDVHDAMRNNLHRRELENERFETLYDIQCDDLSNFHLVVDTTWASPESVAAMIVQAYRQRDPGPAGINGYLCPKSLFPTKDIRDLQGSDAEAADKASADAAGPDEPGLHPAFPINVVRLGHYFFIRDGHARASRALRQGLLYVPCRISPAEAAVHPAGVNEWEEAHGFTFASYPDERGEPTLR
ncbi:MAG: cytidylate kinase [Planctomycetes bacterium ADurb.Bin126]|nr:MAG: cytidylate kinase [Planctomycetes bacterium ADurb.Bin126]HQL71927.1 dephospho-CoA kinase [Phycisphaerae bacterium]